MSHCCPFQSLPYNRSNNLMSSERQSNMPQRYFCIRRSPRWLFNSLRWSTRTKRLSGSFNLAGWHLWWHCDLCLWLMAAADSSRGTVNHFDSVRVCFCTFYVCMYVFLHKCLCIPFSKCIWSLFMSDGAMQFAHSCFCCLSTTWKYLQNFTELSGKWISFAHILYVPIHLHKHTRDTRPRTHFLGSERDGHLTPHPETWHPGLTEITGATMLWCQKSYPGADIIINIVILSWCLA